MAPRELLGFTVDTAALKRLAIKETALLTGLLFVGFVLMPIAIYFVGESVFGDYSGAGYGDFFATLSAKVRDGDMVAWFLILSPYIGWQFLRVLALSWKTLAPKA